jgi:hypothetical protein
VTVLATDQLLPLGLALSPTKVFWTNVGQLDDAGLARNGTGSVAWMPRAGGAPVTIARELDQPLAIAHVGAGPSESLAWSTAGAHADEGTVTFYPFPGGAAPSTTTVASPYGVALSPTDLYWVDDDFVGANAELRRQPFRFGAVGAPNAIAIASGAALPILLAIDLRSAYFTARNASGSGGALFAVSIGGGGVQTLYSTPVGAPFGVATNFSTVYFSDEVAGAVYEVPADGGAVVTRASGLERPFFVAVDSRNVYFATNIQHGAIYQLPVGGGLPVVLADDLDYPAAVAADDLDDRVYFTLQTSIASVEKH